MYGSTRRRIWILNHSTALKKKALHRCQETQGLTLSWQLLCYPAWVWFFTSVVFWFLFVMLFLGPSTKGTFCMCFFQGNWKSLNSLQIPSKLSSWRELFRCFIGLFWILCSKSLYLTWMLSIGDSTTLYSFSHLHVEMWDFLRSSCLLLSKVLKRHPWACWKFLFPGMQIWVLIGSFFFFF